MALIIALLSVRELRRFGALRSDPTRVRAGFRLFRLHWATGIVKDYETWTETVTTTHPEDSPTPAERRIPRPRNYSWAELMQLTRVIAHLGQLDAFTERDVDGIILWRLTGSSSNISTARSRPAPTSATTDRVGQVATSR